MIRPPRLIAVFPVMHFAFVVIAAAAHVAMESSSYGQDTGRSAEQVLSGQFEMQELATDLSIGYAVRAIDVNGDGKLDIAVVDKTRFLWYENPTWKPHVVLEGVTKPDNVCFAPLDIDGDGALDLAVGSDWTLNTAAGGAIHWLRQTKEGPWEIRAIGEEPTVHRMNWVNIDSDEKPELIVLPLLGKDSTRPHFAEQGVRVLAFDIPNNPLTERWPMRVLNDNLHVTHNFTSTDLDVDGRAELVVASFEGLHWLRFNTSGNEWFLTRIGEGNQQTSPNRGCSEVQLGRLSNDRPYFATIEPWHGTQAVVYLPPASGPTSGSLWTRHVLDETLAWGHAVKCANIDQDADEELIVGVRDNASSESQCGVRIFDPKALDDGSSTEWRRELLDAGGVAVEDMAVADLDANGKVDLVAVGRATHNLRIYWNRGSAR